MKILLQKISENQAFAGYVFLLPAMAGALFFIILPLLCSFGLSFAQWDLITPMKFVGFENYRALFSDEIFWEILLNTVVFALATSVFGIIIPLILACILNNKIRGGEFYKTAYFLPFVTPMIVIAIVWSWIFDPNLGVINQLFHLHEKWLYDANLALMCVTVVSVWKLIGYNMIIFLSGLSTLNQNLFEASKIDGASAFNTFKFVTVPLLSPIIFFVVIITAISSFQVFDLIYVMTQGGPLNSTNVLVYSIYQNAFEYFKVGKASAVAYVLFTIILVLTLIQWNLRKKLVYIEKD